MPIFISHSHSDKAFVDSLATRLVLWKHHVWVDRWELGLGDSLMDKIQAAMAEASAVLVILSKNSVNSDWCKRELNAGMVRELEEKRTLVMACVVDDCKIPLFLKDKLYADFFRKPDDAWTLLEKSLARYANQYQSRSEAPDFHTDWAMDWQVIAGVPRITWTFVAHNDSWPYVVLSECRIVASRECSGLLAKRLISNPDAAIRPIAAALVKNIDKQPLAAEPLTDNNSKMVMREVRVPRLGEVAMFYKYRRLGADNGMDTMVYLEPNLRNALSHFDSVTRKR